MSREERPELLAYKNALERAWLDGVITYDEAKMLDTLREHLQIAEEEHWALENDIKSKGPDPGIQEYKTALEQAWMDGLLTEMEKAMLQKLRDKYDINDEIHKRLEDRVKIELGIDARTGGTRNVDSLFDIAIPLDAPENGGGLDTETYWVSKGKLIWYSNAQTEDDRTEALKCFDRAIEINPGSYVAWSYKGAINKKMGYTSDALECYDRAISLRNDFIASWYNKGVLLAQSSITRLEEAIKCFDEVLRLNPDNQLALRDREILQNLVVLTLQDKPPE